MPEKTMDNASRPLVLASTSRYRRALLERLGLPFEVVAPDVDETPLPGEPPAATALRLAEAKARAVARPHPRRAGHRLRPGRRSATARPIGKPGDHRSARSRSCARCPGGRSSFTPASRCSTRERPLPQRAGRRREHVPHADRRARSTTYLRREQPYDCAGAVKSEALGIALFERIESDDPTALIGLPLIALIATAARRRRRRAGRRRTALMTRHALPRAEPARRRPAGRRAAGAHDRRSRARLRHWVVETPKPARAFLKSLALGAPIATLDIAPLPASADAATLAALLAPARDGEDIGLLSDAGCPGVADPGAALVAAAHAAGIARRAAGRAVVAPARADGVGHERPALRVPRLPAGQAGRARRGAAQARRAIRARSAARNCSSRRPIATRRC